jgi:hypothetical protein
VTPGRTAPEASFTVPPIALCACAAVGSAAISATAPSDEIKNLHLFMNRLL